MIKEIALTIGGKNIEAPGGIPMGGTNALPKVVGGLVMALYLVAIFFSLIMLIWGGLNYTMSAGNKEKLQNAKDKIKFALIGLVVALLAYPLVTIFLKMFGLTLF
ncbi:hypothetical protein M1307_00340 [Patescibacteria group bacterium]|nr:hypothetical protein [Patescibacteria group bacterium]